MDGTIPHDVVERVRSATDIVDLVSGYVGLKKSGANYSGLCPFHQEKSPSFSVSPARQIFHCFGCGAGGDVIGFMMKVENFSFPEAVRKLADRAGIEVPEPKGRAGDKGEFEALIKANSDAAGFFEATLRDSREGKKARTYLESRGLPEDVWKEFSIGCAPSGWDGLARMLERKGGADAGLKAGLLSKRQSGQGCVDRFRDRVIFPIRDYRGRIIGFGGRSMGDEMPKYLNSPETPLFKKAEVLYGMDLAAEHIRKKGYAVIVEGYLDVIACHRAGIGNAVATMGTALTPSHLRLLRRSAKNVLLVFDSDAAGIKAAERSLDVFLGSDLTAKVALLPPGDDPDSLFRRAGAEGLDEALRQSERLVEFVIRRMAAGAKEIDEKVSAATAITGLLAKLVSGVERDHCLRLASNELGVKESALREELGRKTGRQTGFTGGRPRPAAAAVGKIEEGLVGIMLSEPGVAEMVKGRLAAEDFEGPLRGLVARIFTLSEQGTVSAARLLDTIEDEAEREQILGLSMKDAVGDPKGFAEGAVERIIKARGEKELSSLQREIAKAQDAGDAKRADELTLLFFQKQRELAGPGNLK